ncbi:MAG: ribose 5-phosphate isomerase B [Clostridia bacterium]|nr:ribose 5-phosphate isomerase B [Clostridia bacterium]MBR2878416.1 ribose 5-phosphate isomerase B [Clostridia bacterium]MBR2973200.1 ribose 5-phosphate isomerase B [Clostridia bacterium]MBR3576217.1 ribose 5-phosphate isomerase B [Clostridia bacterium]
MIAIGADHGGFELKNKIVKWLLDNGYDIKDFGIYENKSVDYPDIAEVVCKSIISGECDRGILVCGTGIGISIAANKIKGIRAAVCGDIYSAAMTKRHNNANVITLGGRVVGEDVGIEIVKAWLTNEFEGGRHQNRIDKITNLENNR